MAHYKMQVLVPILLLMITAVAEAKTPPGIAKNPSNARCSIKKYKHCDNLVHVCPKFCPDQCTVECVSCKPICSGGSSPPPASPTPPTPSPTPPTKTPTPQTYYSPPPPTTSPTPPLSPPTPTTPTIIPTPRTYYSPPPPKTNTTPPLSPPPSTPTPPTTTPTPPTKTPTPPTYSPPPPKTNPTPPLSPPTPTTPTPQLQLLHHQLQLPHLHPPLQHLLHHQLQLPNLHPPLQHLNDTKLPSSYPYPIFAVTSFTPSSNPPSSPSPPTPSPPTSSSPPPPTPTSPKKAKCKNKNYPQCYNIQHVCPTACSGGCEDDCVTCKPVCKCDQPGAVCQDPHFIGGDGITFYFHGKKNHDFCLLSDSNLHINAHFIGRRNHNMKRDFTWVQSIAILFGKHQLFIGAQKTAIWDDATDRLALSFDGVPITLPKSEGARWQSISVPTVSLGRVSGTNNVMVEVEGSFRITAKVVPITEQDSRVHNYGITKDDTFAHLDLGLLATDCAAARFSGSNVGSESEANSLEDLELPSMSCASGMDGRGVVCKR
ncbi:zonadhesin-like [Pyrus ussuriensis x Pyrus communis]|uniref:Zonadhesin-like n=1 Tax=Pyrus ussuriensis x Pyrus communis TaxID=2448454 RepID=A0A5N5I6W9_9ROSA|nr:zonadhesin-like [Pyrus ussuriensis x Pyrus communis]